MNARVTVSPRSHLFAACAALGTAVVLAGCSNEPAVRVSPDTVSTGSPTSVNVAATTPPPAAEPTSVTYAPRVMPSPEEARAAWREGSALYDAGEYATAAVPLEIAATGRPEDSRAHLLLGLALWKSGKADLAEPVLERAAVLDPKSVKIQVNLARVRLEELDEAATALEAADAAVGLDAGSASALHQRGRALALLGRRDEALETLRAAHDADPADGYVANTLGYWLIQGGHEEEAIPFLESSRDRLPGVAFVRNNLGVAYERTGRRDQALEEYRAAVESGDSGGKAAGSLARLGQRLSQPVASTPVENAPLADGSMGQ